MQQKEITHLREAPAHHTRYSGHDCKSVASNRAPLRLFGRGKRVKSVSLNNLRAGLLAVAVAGLLAAVGVFMVVLYAQPAEANFPCKPGKIAYAGYDGQDYEIYTINPNGGGKKQLTDNSTTDIQSSYSHSGKRIAFVNNAGTDGEIWTIQPNGGGRQHVTDNAN